ncbi:EF-hand domain-containing protein [Pseudoxanthomonas wuyuanensis]|uniref:EF hand n=1 Tax=Pseudoxanthomonas wuyuanensis TaxID=1073196 RepID=A0A286DD65_9GAMM|nr:EF-hand domain-containing protein [Pseudoxanthomonas wuyuanensis]KAF1720725.1 hypothetical protein CSC75_10140 [Pseudoxanthomonas wuyuanensis]SOD56569.1 EF hand [Pseudoxanthomonas wuyuanensis]
MKTFSKILVLVVALSATAAIAGEHDHHAAKPAAAATAPRNTADPEFARLDANQDGFISKSELAKHPLLAHFSMADKNKDGKLDKQEFIAGKAML